MRVFRVCDSLGRRLLNRGADLADIHPSISAVKPRCLVHPSKKALKEAEFQVDMHPNAS